MIGLALFSLAYPLLAVPTFSALLGRERGLSLILMGSAFSLFFCFSAFLETLAPFPPDQWSPLLLRGAQILFWGPDLASKWIMIFTYYRLLTWNYRLKFPEMYWYPIDKEVEATPRMLTSLRLWYFSIRKHHHYQNRSIWVFGVFFYLGGGRYLLSSYSSLSKLVDSPTPIPPGNPDFPDPINLHLSPELWFPPGPLQSHGADLLANYFAYFAWGGPDTSGLVNLHLSPELWFPPGPLQSHGADMLGDFMELWPIKFLWLGYDFQFSSLAHLPAVGSLLLLRFFIDLDSLFLWILSHPANEQFPSLGELNLSSFPMGPCFQDNLGLMVDGLSAPMGLLVCGIHFGTQLYASQYMSGDPAKLRFSLTLLFFALSMFLMVYSCGLLQLFLGWEGIGLASYLLIGFWAHRSQSVRSGFKALAMNRLGDVALLLAIALMYVHWGTGLFRVSDKLATVFPQLPLFGLSAPELCAFLVFTASAAKSAQLFFSPWLSDAMEGPTPVSALLHSATMVTAGVYLSLRFPIFASSSCSTLISSFYLIFGLSTAFFGAYSAACQQDLKRVVAFSTTSNLGLMFSAIGLQQFYLAQAHLLVHGLYKAFFFFSAGLSMSAAGGNQDLRRPSLLLFSSGLSSLFSLSLAFSLAFPGLASFYTKEPLIASLYLYWSPTAAVAHGAAVLLLLLTSHFSLRPIIRFALDHSPLVAPAPSSAYSLLPPVLLAFFSLTISPFALSFLDKRSAIALLPSLGAAPVHLSEFMLSNPALLFFPLACSLLGALPHPCYFPNGENSLSDPLNRLGFLFSVPFLSNSSIRWLESRWTPNLGYGVWSNLLEFFGNAGLLGLPPATSPTNGGDSSPLATSLFPLPVFLILSTSSFALAPTSLLLLSAILC